MRLFIGLDCSQIKPSLTAIQKRFYPIKAAFPQSFHLTIKYLGNVHEVDLPWIDKQLRGVDTASFSLSIDKIGTFTTFTQKIIWAGVANSTPLNQLQLMVDNALYKRFEKAHKFSPHITIARIKKHHKLFHKERQCLTDGLSEEIQTCKLMVDRFSLVESVLAKQGAIYKDIKSYPLM